MKYTTISRKLLAVGACAALIGLASCKSSSTNPPVVTPSTPYTETVLVADTLGFGASQKPDSTFKNGWGISVNTTNGAFWLSSNHGGVTNVYSGTGSTLIPAIAVPSRNGTDPGSPSGVIFNSTTDFKNEKFIYSTEDGIIAAWSGTMSKVATSSNATAVYKGLAMANNGGSNFLYATDFHNGKVDVYDKNFVQQTSGFAFSDPSIPAGFAPFGIQSIGDSLYVTYAKQDAAQMDDAAGAGNGYINIFKADGTLVKRFASQGKLNSPWGITIAPSTFGEFPNALLVSNFGDGTISGYNDTTGTFIGQVSTDANNTPMHIAGLWGIMAFGSAPPGVIVPNSVYFTAGPGGEDHGLFGYIKMQ